jgi:acetamidase/formamidase
MGMARWRFRCGIIFAAFWTFPALAADIAGTWALYAMDRGEITDATRLELSVNGTIVTGKGRGLLLTGTLTSTAAGDDIRGSVTREDGRPFGSIEMHLHGDEGGAVITSGATTRNMTLHRLPGPVAPKTVTFAPKNYPRLFGPGEPALRINAGDTVRTSTLDAGGRDASDTSRALGGNPQNGPIYIDGAIPGDTLSVTINRIRLDKKIARSGNTILPVALTADYYREAKLDPRVEGQWTLDTQAGTAALARPSERLKDFKVPLKPMLGGIGVAPARNEAFRTQQLGNWGGNLDYNGITEGTTVYLPVSREGALLYVGDVHALQGDGELNGDALETSAELELRIDVVPGIMTTGPRAENSLYLMSSGIAGSMEAALRQATTQLTQWLERDYALTPSEAAIVLGTTIEYDIAEVVDPQFHIVAKVRKAALAGLKRVQP